MQETIEIMELVVLKMKGTDFVTDIKCEKMNPKMLMLTALGRCAGLTALSIFKKMDIRPESFEIECRGEISTPTLVAESVFTAVNIVYTVECQTLAEQGRVSRALNLTHDKYCGMVKMMRKVAPLSHEIYIHSTRPVSEKVK